MSDPARKIVDPIPAPINRQTQLLVLLFAGCLTTMTGSAIFPVFPEMMQQLNLDPRWAGTLFSIHALTSALSTPVMGVLSDRLGKLKVMVPCLILYTIFGVSTPFLSTMPLLLASRALLGVASGGVAAATIGILGSMYEGEARSRILGYATSAMTTAAIFFPLVGGWVGDTHWQYAFYLYGFGLPLAVAAALILKEPQLGSGSVLPVNQNQLLRQLLKSRRILTLYLFIWATGMIMYAVVVYTPPFLKEAIQATPKINGIALAARLVGAALASAFVAARVTQRLGRQRAIAFGFSLMAMTVVTLPFLTSLVLILPAAMIFGAGFGIITPNLYDLLAELSPVAVRATVLALGTGFNSLGQFISPVILGAIWKSAGLPLVFFSVGGMAAIASFLSLTRILQSEPIEAEMEKQ